MLAVDIDYDEPKAALWARHGKQWTEQLAVVAAAHTPFSLRFRWIVATNTAVVALAELSEPLQQIREEIRAILTLPPPTKAIASIVHTTLYRYGSHLADPIDLLKVCDSLEFEVPTEVRDLTISEERIYPPLDSSVHAHLALAGRRTARPAEGFVG